MTDQHHPDHDQRRTTRRSVLKGTAAAATAVTIPSTAAATGSESLTDSLLPDVASTFAYLRGRAGSSWERRFGERSEAKAAAIDAKDEFNAHSGEWVDYINEYASTDGEEVLEIEFAPDPDTSAYTVYLVGDYDTSNEAYTSAEIVEDTDRTVDEKARLESVAADNAADEIETGYEEFVTEDRAPTDEHLAYLGGRYAYGTDHVTSTLLGDDL